VEFSVGFYFKVPKDDEEAADLIGVAANYILGLSAREYADQDEIIT
jgi:hypothetical protein